MQQLCDHGDKDWSQPSLISDNDPYLTTAEQQVSAASFPLLPLARAVPCGVGQRLKQNLALEALVVLCGTARAGCDNCCRIIRWGLFPAGGGESLKCSVRGLRARRAGRGGLSGISVVCSKAKANRSRSCLHLSSPPVVLTWGGPLLAWTPWLSPRNLVSTGCPAPKGYDFLHLPQVQQAFCCFPRWLLVNLFRYCFLEKACWRLRNSSKITI